MKGICFTKSMFLATIEGRKTQTRRMVADRNLDFFLENFGIDNIDIVLPKKEEYVNKADYGNIFGITRKHLPIHYCGIIKSRYKVGETVYLKEPYCIIETDDVIFYKYAEKDISGTDKWKNKLFMPEKYARYFIEITDVKCERLQDISDEDCLKEGIIYDDSSYIACEEYTFLNNIDDWLYDTPSEAYAALIDKISGKGTWKSNPYVFAYDFKLINNK